MTVITERTVMPPEHPEGLSGVLALLVPQPAGHATLTGPDGTRLELPDEVFEVLREVVAALSQGLAITVAPHQTVLSTTEAAQLLGVRVFRRLGVIEVDARKFFELLVDGLNQ